VRRIAGQAGIQLAHENVAARCRHRGKISVQKFDMPRGRSHSGTRNAQGRALESGGFSQQRTRRVQSTPEN
jgi:hypothetical protein